MRKSAAVAFIAVALLLLTCSGCAPLKPAEPPIAPAFDQPLYDWGKLTGATLTLWGRETDLNRSYMTRAFARYEQLTGNTVKTVAFAPEEFELAAAKALGGGAGPDLLLSFGGTNMDAFDPDENFYDFTHAQWVEDLTEVSINQTVYHGKIIGLPHWEASISGTLYNKRIFERLNLEPPRTQEQFLAACETLLQNGVIPLYLPCASPTMLLYQFALDTLVETDNTLERLNEGTLGYADLPGMEKVVNWYRAMARRGYLGPNYMQNSWDGMSEALESGQYAMLLCWDTWLYTDYAGDPAQFGLMPAFIGVPEAGTFEGPNLSLLLVNRHSAQLDAALDLVAFMADPYNYNDAFAGIYTAPVFKRQVAGISTPQYVEAQRWIEENFHTSTAWLRIRGFSQSDAVCILAYMQDQADYTAQDCLKDMDALRRERLLGQA